MGGGLFNDALFFLKTGDEIIDPLRVFVSDKEFVKLYVKAVVGDKYNVPTLGVLRDRAEVDVFAFPERCCIKPTQASGAVVFRTDGEEIDLELLKSWFDLSHYRKSRERNYKRLRAKIIVEPLIFDESDVIDYRFFCYNGAVKVISLDIGKYSSYERAFYSPEWNELPFSLHYPKARDSIPRPGNLDEMIMVASSLSERFGFVRVDLYSNGVECFVGEITHCHASAGQQFVPLSAEREASDLIFL